MDPGRPDRGGPVPDGFQRLHQSERDICVVRVLGREALPPAHRRTPISGFGGGAGQGVERSTVAAGESLPLHLQPTFELLSVRQEEPVEHRAAVERYRGVVVRRRNGFLEFDQITPECLVAETHLVTGGYDRALADLAPYRVNRLTQQVPGASRLSFGPEIGDEPISQKPAGMGRSQQREQGEPVALRGRPAQRARATLESHTSEDQK